MKIFSKKSEITYKTIGTSSLNVLCKLEKQCFGQEAWSASAVENDINSENTVWIAAFYGNDMIGYINGMSVCDEAELNRIAVISDFRSSGIGTELVNLLLLRLSQKGCKTVFLEVRESNVGALALYEKNKFKKYGVRKNYYNNPTENAILMLREI